MHRILLVLLLAEAAFASVGQNGGDSFETALQAEAGTFPVGGVAGSGHYFFTNVTAGSALSVTKSCDDPNVTLPLYNENLQVVASGMNGTTRWSASSDNQTYKIYLVATLCSELDWVEVSVENRQDLGSGRDAGGDIAGAVPASDGASNGCCHLSLDNGIEGGNDKEDMYALKTYPGTKVTVDTMAPLELVAYTMELEEISRADSRIEFMPPSGSSYLLVRTTPSFSSGQNSNYSLVIEGAGQQEAGAEGGQQQQQALAGEKNGTRKEASRTNATSGQTNNPGPDDPGQQEDQPGKGTLETVSDQIMGTIKRAEQEYGTANTSGQANEKPKAEGAASKKAMAMIIAAAALLLVARARRSA